MLYIHIGAPKTGTTSVQGFLTDHAATLEQHGVLYPSVGLTHRGKHHELKAELRSTEGAGGPAWAALRALRESRPDQHVLISEESFYYLDPSALTRLRELAGPGPVTILVYFRDYAAHAASLYAQGTKSARGLDEGEGLGTKAGNELLDFDDFFERYLAKPSHFDIISRWAAVFGWDAIRVRPYHRSLLVGGDIVADLLDVLGLNLASLGVTPKQEVNLAPSWKALETLRAVWQVLEQVPGGTVNGRIPAGLRQLCREVIETHVPDAGRGQYLSLAQQQRCAEATKRDISALQARLAPPGISFPQPEMLSERPFLPTVDQIPANEVALVLAHMALRAFGGTATAGQSEPADALKAERKAARRARRAAEPASADAPAAARVKPNRGQKAGRPGQADRADKPGKANKLAKADKPAKADKAHKPAKADKADKPARAERLAHKQAKQAARQEAGTKGQTGQAPVAETSEDADHE